jgi:lytic murein transglycosylase
MFDQSVRTCLGMALIAFTLVAPASASQSAAQAGFKPWLEQVIWPQVSKRGVPRASFDGAVSGLRLNFDLPDLVLPGQKPGGERKQLQAEFRSPGAYFDAIGGVISGGKSRLTAHAATLRAVEQAFGVPGHIVVAIWGRESGFGRAKIPYDAMSVLATKAYLSTRKDLFTGEFLAGLEMIGKGLASEAQMKSSWAGAMGQPQFMPSSYLAHAVDFDGDGKRDIWNSVPDTLGSIGAYLRDFGWQRGRDWGFEVNLPASVSCSLEGPDRGKTIAQWAAMGITRVNGKAFPANELKGKGFLMLPAGRFGPAFIVTPNFYVIKEYNESDLYALFIGHAGDRMAYSNTAFVTNWGNVGGMLRSDVASLQRALEAKGYDVGGADGLPGNRTRRSIGEWQAKAGLEQTCFPQKRLIDNIR